MRSNKHFPSERKSFLDGTGWKFLILFVALLCVFALFLHNSSRLMKILNANTKAYLEDVAYQNSRRIEEVMKGKMNSLESVADSLEQLKPGMDGEEVKEFLTRKADLFNFQMLLILDRNRNFIISHPGQEKNLPGTTDDFLSIPSIQRSFEGTTEANYTRKESIFYSAPIVRGGKIDEIVIGVRDKDKILDLISSRNFEGQMISCIVDHTGGVVISPLDMAPFLELDDLFNTAKDPYITDSIFQMQSDMAEGRNGSLRFPSVSGDELFMSYNALNINDWYLLTIIPADILSSGPQLYILQSFLTAGLIILVFLILVYSLLRFYHSHKKQLEKIAYCDPVTGGLNNTAFQARYREMSPSLEPGSCAIVLLNVIGFKFINEQFGMEVGNQTLSYIHSVLGRHLKDNEVLARGESDYFFLCLMESTEEAVQKRLDESIADINGFCSADFPFTSLSFKRGACLVDDPGQDISLLQEHARLALLKYDPAQRQECSFYDISLIEQLKTEQELNSLFEDSLKNHFFQVYLQPKISAKTRKLMGAEALVRWKHPEKGTIFPSDFIPLFENNGKICQLDFYVFRETCATIHRWKNMGIPLFPISVNLSRQHFKDPKFLEPFFQTAKEFNIPDNILEFELTESIFFESQEIDHVKQIICDMHDHGFLCSLDDFGSGFSSLGLLKEFDVDSLKLDRCFFHNMSNQKAKDVIACLINLAKCLDAQTVAEGIEDLEQVKFLSDMNCDMIQGFVFSRPIPIEEFEEKYLRE